MSSYDKALALAAETLGIQAGYWDIWGRRHVTSPEVQRSILTSLGVDTSSETSLRQALELRAGSDSLFPSVLVLSAASGRLPVRGPESGEVPLRFEWEDGSTHEQTGRIEQGTVRLPENAPLGYHTVCAHAGEKSCRTRLILCPDRAWLPHEGFKAAGIAISLYGLRSERNWGCGDFTDLEQFIDWAAGTGAAFIALNPLHAIANRQPYNTSPYLPECTYYRNPLYIDVDRVADLPSCYRTAALNSQLAALRAASYVEYEKVYELKVRYLRAAFRRFLNREYHRDTPRARDFRQFVLAEGRLLDEYALYCALSEVLHRRSPGIWIWPDWPPEYQQPESAESRDFARKHWRTVLFFKYLQWLVDQQLAAAHQHARNRGLAIGLYHDLALATDRCGADLWTHREFFVSGCRVGSPPDDFSPSGQDWAFPPPNSLRHVEDGYRLFAESIRKNCRHGGALRIDHVMRFFRLFWIPEGKQARDGAYVRDRAEDLIRILALESVRNQVIIIGEDLGTVEPGVRETLARFGILSYRLLYFEKNAGKFQLPEEYPKQALVSASTHDLPTLAGFWIGRDIEARRKGGLIDEESYRIQRADRTRDKQGLLDALLQSGLLPQGHPQLAEQIPEFTGELHNAVTGFLASTPSVLMALNQEDLFKDPDQQNLPGSTEQYPNWRHKMRFSLEDLETSTEANAFAAMFRAWLERTDRVNRI